MTKRELIEKIASHHKHRSISKAAASDLVESLFDNLAVAIRRGRRFSYPGFGTFLVRKRRARKGRNPKTGQTMTLPETRTVIFRPAMVLKDELK